MTASDVDEGNGGTSSGRTLGTTATGDLPPEQAALRRILSAEWGCSEAYAAELGAQLIAHLKEDGFCIVAATLPSRTGDDQKQPERK